LNPTPTRKRDTAQIQLAMARKKKHPEHENHERWLVSYADFITLLFAFFVVMFASSQADKGKAQQVSESVKKALEGEKMSAVVAAVLGGTAADKGQGNVQMKGPGGTQKLTDQKPEDQKPGEQKPDEQKKTQKLVELMPSLKVLSAELRTEIDAGRVQVQMEPRGLVISFRQAALFPSGEDVVSQAAYPSLDKLASAMIKIPNPIRLEGHTDAVPIKTARFHSNWELSTARSIALLELLSSRFQVPVQRISVAGYAANAPVASNGSEEGRAKNRRVDIVILNEQGALAEPNKAEPNKSEPSKGEANNAEPKKQTR
jgi:chemotaxis protein MotB